MYIVYGKRIERTERGHAEYDVWTMVQAKEDVQAAIREMQNRFDHPVRVYGIAEVDARSSVLAQQMNKV